VLSAETEAAAQEAACRDLWLAVLGQALEDALTDPRGDAWFWLQTDQETPGSAFWICAATGLDLGYLRRLLFGSNGKRHHHRRKTKMTDGHFGIGVQSFQVLTVELTDNLLSEIGQI